MGIILYIVSVVLSLLFYIPGLIWAIIKLGFKGGFLAVNEYFMLKAISVDQFGNVWASPLFNDIMKKKSGYAFGEEDETISSVLGKNKRDETLSTLGGILADTLDFIDENHCLKSIEEDEDVNS